jgi:hypothetical protein
VSALVGSVADGRGELYVAAAVLAVGYLVVRLVLRVVAAVAIGLARAVSRLVMNAVLLLAAGHLVDSFPTAGMLGTARASFAIGLLSALRHVVNEMKPAMSTFGVVRRPTDPT